MGARGATIGWCVAHMTRLMCGAALIVAVGTSASGSAMAQVGCSSIAREDATKEPPRLPPCEGSFGVSIEPAKKSYSAADTVSIAVANEGADTVYFSLHLEGYKGKWVPIADDIRRFLPGYGSGKNDYTVEVLPPKSTYQLKVPLKSLGEKLWKYSKMNFFAFGYESVARPNYVCYWESRCFTIGRR